MGRGRVASKGKVSKGQGPQLSGKLDITPDVETVVLLDKLTQVWGCGTGFAITCILDTWAMQSLEDAMGLQAAVAAVHPEWAGKPLLRLPRDVFLAGCQHQDLANRAAWGVA